MLYKSIGFKNKLKTLILEIENFFNLVVTVGNSSNENQVDMWQPISGLVQPMRDQEFFAGPARADRRSSVGTYRHPYCDKMADCMFRA